MLNMPGHILILTGSPGAGKTTTAGILASEAAVPAVHLHTDDFYHFIRKGAIAPYLPEAHRQNTVVMSVIARAAAAYADGGYFVVVDGIIGPWFLPIFRTLSQPLHYIVLRPTLAVALERCRTRVGDGLSAPEPIVALHRQFSDLGELERHVMETVGFGIKEIAGIVEQAVASGKYRLDG